jgi:formamidase
MPYGNKTDTTTRHSVVVDRFTNSALDPNESIPNPVEDNESIVANIAPHCCGPMITPILRGELEVTQPVFIMDRDVGDCFAIEICNITVTSITNASGHDSSPDGLCLGDPYVTGRFPTCDTVWPANDFAHRIGISFSANVTKLDKSAVK